MPSVNQILKTVQHNLYDYTCVIDIYTGNMESFFHIPYGAAKSHLFPPIFKSGSKQFLCFKLN